MLNPFRLVEGGNDSADLRVSGVDETASAQIDADVRNTGFVGVGEENNVSRFEKLARNGCPVTELLGGRVGEGVIAQIAHNAHDETGAIEPTRALASPNVRRAEITLGDAHERMKTASFISGFQHRGAQSCGEGSQLTLALAQAILRPIQSGLGGGQIRVQLRQ